MSPFRGSMPPWAQFQMYQQWQQQQQQQHWQHDRPGRTATDFNVEELSDDSPHGGQMVGLQRQGSRDHGSQQMLSLKHGGAA